MVIFLIYISGIRFISSLVLGLIIGQIILNLLAPTQDLTNIPFDSNVAFYILIQFATPIIVLIYVFIIASHDIRKNNCINGNNPFKIELDNSEKIK